MKLADCIIAISNNTKKDVISMLNTSSDKVTTIPNGVDAQFRVISSDRNYFDFSDILLETLIKKGLPVRLWKVGSDFTAEQQAYIGDRQLESQITSLGYPDRETLIELYNAADLLLAPSLYEGFELTILEAIEAELEQNPIPNLKFIYFTLPFWQMGQSGQQRVKELYSWQAKGKQLCQTYQQIVER